MLAWRCFQMVYPDNSKVKLYLTVNLQPAWYMLIYKYVTHGTSLWNIKNVQKQNDYCTSRLLMA